MADTLERVSLNYRTGFSLSQLLQNNCLALYGFLPERVNKTNKSPGGFYFISRPSSVNVSIMASEMFNESPWGLQPSTSHEVEQLEPGVLKIPVELIVKIIELIDFRSVLSLVRANRRFKEIYEGNRGHILLSILGTELSPLEEALQIITFEPEDIEVPLGPCLRRRIYHKNKLVCEGESSQPGDDDHVLLPPAVLDAEHFERLIRLFEAVKAWEQLFPRYRFQPASDCRELHPRESKRLRAALYRWMSYAQFFHGDLPRPNSFVPQHGSTDIRCKRLRLLSDHELHELDDLWETVQRMVKGDICPSTEAVLKEMVNNESDLFTSGADTNQRFRTTPFPGRRQSGSASVLPD